MAKSFDDIKNAHPIKITDDTETNIAQIVEEGGVKRLAVTSNETNIFFADGSQLDAFHRLRVSNPHDFWNHKFLVPHTEGIYWDSNIVGSATITHDANLSSTCLDTTTASGDKATLTTKRHFHYIPGKSLLYTITGNFKGNQTNVVKNLGVFDELDGFIFRLNGNSSEVVIRSSTSGSAVDTAVTQANWNIDKLDGAGPSGIIIDWTKQQIFFIDFQWLGSGRVRFGLGLDGDIVYFHEFLHANILEVPYMKLPTLPIRCEVENTATLGSPASMRLTCISVIAEGGTSPEGNIATFDSGTTEITIGSTEAPIFSIRLDPTKNRNSARPIHFDILNTSGTKAIIYKLYHNGTLTSPSWTNIGLITQYDLDATDHSNGYLLQSGYINVGGSTTVAPTKEVEQSLYLGRHYNGDSTTVTVTLQTLGGAAKVLVSGLIRELI